MNKLLLNEKARNHIRFFPMKGVELDLPEDEADRIRWCENEFDKLQHSMDANRLAFYKHRNKGYLISVWEMEGRYYLIQCLRNEFKTFNTTIYISNDKDDCLNIAKFLDKNADQVMKDYKQQILDARDWLLSQQKQEETEIHDA